MKAGGGKSKGGSFERWVARELSKWWSDGEREDIFARTGSSGAWATQRNKQSKQTFGQYGDIQAIDPMGQPLIDKFLIECKTGYGKWDILDIIDGKAKNNVLNTFIQQVEKDLEASQREEYLLIMKRDYKEPIVSMYQTPVFWQTLIEQYAIVKFKEKVHIIFSLENFLAREFLKSVLK